MFLERIAETVLRQTVLIPNIFFSRSGEKLLGVIRRCRRQEEISYWTQKFSNITHQIRNRFLPEKKNKNRSHMQIQSPKGKANAKVS